MTLTISMGITPLDHNTGYVPEGWALTTLRVACEINPPKASKDSVTYDAPVSFVPMPAVDADEGAITKPQIKRFSEVRKGFTSFREDDVIMAKITPCMENGKAAIAKNLMNGLGFGSTEFHVLRSTEAVRPEFVYHFIRQESYRRAAGDEMTGSVGQKRVPQWFLEATEVPLPPLSEQIRIVTRLTELMTALKASHEHLSQVPLILKRFRQAVLAAACSGRLTADWREKHPEIKSMSLELERYDDSSSKVRTRRGVPDELECPNDLTGLGIPESWTLRSVASLLRLGILRDVKDGNHGSNHPKTSELGDYGLPFITAAQVKNYQIDYESAPKVGGEARKRLKVGFAETGDVILTHKGTVGRAAVNMKPCVLTPQTTYYRCDSQVLNPAYLVYLFTSPLFYSQLAAVMSQTTRDFVPISEQYRLFLVLAPPEEQQEISRRVDALFAFADKVQQSLVGAKARVDRLTQSILAKAFRGELVPTEAELARREGRDYEPASVLLERIKKERASQVETTPNQRRSARKASDHV